VIIIVEIRRETRNIGCARQAAEIKSPRVGNKVCLETKGTHDGISINHPQDLKSKKYIMIDHMSSCRLLVDARNCDLVDGNVSLWLFSCYPLWVSKRPVMDCVRSSRDIYEHSKLNVCCATCQGMNL
jgi:hypothetical protein